MSAPIDKSLKSMHRKVEFMMSIFRSDSKYSDMFKEFESGGASGSGRCGDDEESDDDEDDDGERLSLGIIAGDCIPDEDSPATIPQRHFAGDRFPQRHVAGENPKMLLGKTPIVVNYTLVVNLHENDTALLILKLPCNDEDNDAFKPTNDRQNLALGDLTDTEDGRQVSYAHRSKLKDRTIFTYISEEFPCGI
ncbi:hypothetical protein Tco_0871295 [Tanacetum coccineum]